MGLPSRSSWRSEERRMATLTVDSWNQLTDWLGAITYFAKTWLERRLVAPSQMVGARW